MKAEIKLPIEIQASNMNRQVTKWSINMDPIKYMGKYSNSHIAREMQIKILLQYHFSHSRLGKSSKA